MNLVRLALLVIFYILSAAADPSSLLIPPVIFVFHRFYNTDLYCSVFLGSSHILRRWALVRHWMQPTSCSGKSR